MKVSSDWHKRAESGVRELQSLYGSRLASMSSEAFSRRINDACTGSGIILQLVGDTSIFTSMAAFPLLMICEAERRRREAAGGDGDVPDAVVRAFDVYLPWLIKALEKNPE